MSKIKKRDFETDYVKAVKKVMREEVGLMPTRVAKPKKIYNRNQMKNIDRNSNFDI